MLFSTKSRVFGNASRVKEMDNADQKLEIGDESFRHQVRGAANFVFVNTTVTQSALQARNLGNRLRLFRFLPEPFGFFRILKTIYNSRN